ncbi:hypothetical protein PHYBOEH_003399 [Phytophthora boehmeriae]|uniref:SAC3/GANP/THP3 conserved domain-containing protein n=1 Tax=Phytophthora boehmeriae TaxID=109152 RepID=A0A8T1WNP6_9STRA|nr:hypothetical protein PHYBOEH_003399 [Phytophthora boehmeriae]
MARGRWRSGRGRHNASPPPAPACLHQSPLQGECQRLCPPKEEAERARTNELSRFECATAEHPELVAVKKYRRAAAGRDTYDAQDVRPAPVLLDTLRHLFTAVLEYPKGGFEAEEDARPAEFLALYHFINDRIRSGIENEELVIALQQAVRFYLVAGLRAVQLLGTLKNQQDWSDKLNDEQLASALSQLQTLYRMQERASKSSSCSVGGPELETAGEFVAYDLLLHADDPQATDDFHRFALEFDAMSLLERAITLRHLPRIWTCGIKMMNKAFGKQDRFPLEELARWMLLAGFKSECEGGEQAEKLCKALNIQAQRHPPPIPPTFPQKSDAADSWEAIDVHNAELVPSASTERVKLSSLGFAQFKITAVHEAPDLELARTLVHDVASCLREAKEEQSMTKLITGMARC